MIEKSGFLRQRKPAAILAAALTATALSGCTVESYLTDNSNVQCDGNQTEAPLNGNGNVAFIVHGENKKDVATVNVRRDSRGVSLNVTGSVTGPPQQLEPDGYTKPVPIESTTQLSAFGADGAWIINVSKTDVIIQGSCQGM